ncbi:MAG TPA: hypothetical protein VGL62_04605 [Vicinamibacterales bacterium]
MRRLIYSAVAAALFAPWSGSPATVPVLHAEGVVHGFLSLATLDGRHLADGDLVQTADKSEVTSRLVFRFADGSLNDETTVFTERGRFRLVRDHLVQHGPSFPQPVDLSIDAASGHVTVHYGDPRGRERTVEDHLTMPDDLANGMVLTLLKNLAPGAQATTVSLVAVTPKPRLVTLTLTPAGSERFSTGAAVRRVREFSVHVHIGGLAGLLAPLVGT